MLNRLLSRQGLEIGAIVTAGQEDYLRIERGIQTYLGYSYSDRLHLATHFHNPPLVPRERMKGVRGRIDVMGAEVLPLREEDAREAAAELLDAGVEGICISLLFSYRNAEHEMRVGRDRRGGEGEARPRRRGAGLRLLAALPDAPRPAAAQLDPDRGLRRGALAGDLQAVREKTKEAGAGFELRVMASHGGRSRSRPRSWRGRWSRARSAASSAAPARRGHGPSQRALHRHRRHLLRHRADHRRALRDHPDPGLARFLLAMPLVKIDSIGAGTGSFVRVNPNSNRPELGPDSAGSRIGVCWPEGGLETVSVTDLNLVLGRVNPDYFLGGDVELDPERARAEVERQVAEPARPRGRAGGGGGDRAVRADAEERGGRADPRQGLLARPTTRCSATAAAVPCTSPATPRACPTATSWCRPGRRGSAPTAAPAPTSSTATTRRSTCRSSRPPTRWRRPGVGMMISGSWLGLQERVAEEFAKSGVEREQIAFTHAVRMQYYGQLNDIEIVSPHIEIEDAEVDDLIAVFEEAYGKVFARSARSPGARLPGHSRDRARLGRGREARAPRRRRARGSPPAKATRGSAGATSRADRHLRARRRPGRQRDRGPGDRRVGGDDVRDPAGPLGPRSTATRSSTSAAPRPDRRRSGRAARRPGCDHVHPRGSAGSDLSPLAGHGGLAETRVMGIDH